MIEPTTRLRRCSDVRYRHIPPETLLIRQSGPEILVLNGIAGRLLDLLSPGVTAGDLVEAMQREYDGPPADVERDTLAFLDDLLATGIVEVATGG